MKVHRLSLSAFALAAAMIFGAGLEARQNKAADGAASGASSSASRPAAAADNADNKDAKPDPALVDKGKARYQVYRCFDCHGKNGEGTEDAPDLIGTHLDAAGIAKFLDKPSADAQAKGMPNVPAGSDDSKALVAFVLSIKKAN